MDRAETEKRRWPRSEEEPAAGARRKGAWRGEDTEVSRMWFHGVLGREHFKMEET